MRVEFVIDEIVLHGVDPRDRHRIRDAIERHLQTQLSRESVVGRIANDARNREQAIAGMATRSVGSAVSTAARRSNG